MKYSLWQILQLPKLQLPFQFSLETILGDIFSIGVIGWYPGYEIRPKSACDFLAPLLLSRNRRFAEGILITRKPIPCSIESSVPAPLPAGANMCIHSTINVEHMFSSLDTFRWRTVSWSWDQWHKIMHGCCVAKRLRCTSYMCPNLRANSTILR